MNLLRLVLFCAGCGLLCLAPLAAAPAEKVVPAADAANVIYPRSSDARPEPAAGRGSGYTALLFTALLLAGAAGWLFWRGRSAPGVAKTTRKLVIAETKSLGNRQYLVVASYEDKKFLLSVCPGRIELLTPLDGSSPVKLP